MSDLASDVSVESNRRAVHDPATGEVIGHVVDDSQASVFEAVARAKSARSAWAERSDESRRQTLLDIAHVVEDAAEDLARLLSREQGKPLNGANARFEIGACVAWLRATAEIALPAEDIHADPLEHVRLTYRPLGVVAAIGPWNWPLMITIWQTAAALRMGNTVVVKPSEYTPLSVQALVEAMSGELPEGVLQIVQGGAEVGSALTTHPDVSKVMFTGSTETGRAIVAGSAGNLARLTLELGGNDAGIILPGAEVARIAPDLFWGAFLNNGQTCAALKRLYVHGSIYDEVVTALAEIARTTPMGNGLDETSLLGPVQNRAQFDIIAALVEDARAHGARVAAGGEPASELGPLFYRPTIVADVADGVALVDQEQFGPVLPVIPYDDVDDAIERANASSAGLGASVWGPDDAESRRIAARLEAGTVWINSHGGVHPLVPFGGIKASGYGLEFGVEGLKAVAAPQVING